MATLKIKPLPSKSTLHNMHQAHQFLAALPVRGAVLTVVRPTVVSRRELAKVLYVMDGRIVNVTETVATIMGLPLVGGWNREGIDIGHKEALAFTFTCRMAFQAWGKSVTVCLA